MTVNAAADVDISSVGMVLRLLGRFRIRYGVNLLLWVAIWVMPVLPGFIVADFFRRLENDAADGAGIVTLAVLLAAYGLGRAAVILVGIWSDANLNFRLESLLRRNMLRRIYDLPGAQAGVRSSGETISRFREDVEFVAETSGWTVDGVGGILSAIAAAVILARIDIGLTVLVFLPTFAIVMVAARLRARVRRAWEEARHATGVVTQTIGETFGATTAVKLAGAEESMLDHLRAVCDTRRDKMVRVGVLQAILEALFANIVNVGTGLVLLVAAGSISAEGGLTVGRFALFVYLMGVVSESGGFIGSTIARLKQISVSFERMAALLRGAGLSTLSGGGPLDLHVQTSTGDAADAAAAQRDEPSLRSLTVRDLHFTYPGSDNGIRGIDLDITGGSFTVIVGRVGAGKTTLLRAVLGLVESDGGEIRWNDAFVADPARWFVPPRSAYVPQVPRLLSMSLRDNITLGGPYSDQEVHLAIATAALDPDVAAMPAGLDTMVGPLGVRLSGGQLQRTAAARMLLGNAELLVFDDLSSALDVETEQRLWDRIGARSADMTALVVSHRRAALERADHIVVLDEGRVVAEGGLTELLASSSDFARIWAHDEPAVPTAAPTRSSA